MPIRLQTIVLFVMDLNESRTFYEQVIGLDVQAVHETHVEYIGGLLLWQVHHAYDAIFHRPATGVVQLGADNCVVRFVTDNMMSITQRIALAQLPVIETPDYTKAGLPLLRLHDPDGHLVEIVEMLPSGVIQEISQQRLMLTAVSAIENSIT